MPDMTITALRTTLLRVPWPQTPWLKGHAFGDARNLLVLDVETKGGIVGMGYLFPSMVRRSANEVKALALVSTGRLEPGEHRGQHPGPGYALRQAVAGAFSRVDPRWTPADRKAVQRPFLSDRPIAAFLQARTGELLRDRRSIWGWEKSA